MGRFVKQGCLAGLAGGAALALVLQLAGQGSIGRAIAIEHAAGHGDGGAEMFGRGAQQAGGAGAALLYGLAAGALFAVAFSVFRSRVRSSDWQLALWLTAVAFVVVFLVPFVKYPANPPAVGDPDTVTQRTVLYLTVLGWSMVAAWATWKAWRNLGTRAVADHIRLPAAALLWVVLVACGMVLLPANPDRVEVPAGLLWDFRLAGMGGAVAFWAVTGMVFGYLRAGVRPAAAALSRPEAGAHTR